MTFRVLDNENMHVSFSFVDISGKNKEVIIRISPVRATNGFNGFFGLWGHIKVGTRLET